MKKLFLLIFLIISSVQLFSQNDSLVFFNGNVIVGEIKVMDKGNLNIETDYSDTNFKIELEKIKNIHCNISFHYPGRWLKA